MKIKLETLKLLSNYLEIHGTIIYEKCELVEKPCIQCNLETISIHMFYQVEPNNKNFKKYRFQIKIPLANTINQYHIYFVAKQFKKLANIKITSLSAFFPISLEYSHSYYSASNWILTANDGSLYIYRYAQKKHLKFELLFCWQLLCKQKIKAIFIRLLCFWIKKLQHKEIWIIYDRINRADDNGEAFFRYLQKINPNDINLYFLLDKHSPDYNRIKKIGKIVPFFSFREKLLFLLCQYKISSQADHYTTYPFGKDNYPYRDFLQYPKFIFLQHGIIKDNLSKWLNQYNRNIYGFVTSSPLERNSILELPYEYNNENVWLTGLPRYDYLYKNEEKWIIIMPTWRKYLMENEYSISGQRNLKSNFHLSDFYISYSAVILDKKLNDYLSATGYKLGFMPHPMMEPYIDEFPHSPNITYFSKMHRYCDLFAKADLIITDYSSAVFDFALLKKPIIYFQFDEERFFGGEHTYSKGYFDYTSMGFGEITKSVDDLVESIIKCITNGCKMPHFYQKRIDMFFSYIDKNNCERIYNLMHNEIS